MAKRDHNDREDLIHILTDTIASEGYEIDNDIELEITKLAKYIIVKANFTEEEPEDFVDNSYEEDKLLLEPIEYTLK